LLVQKNLNGISQEWNGGGRHVPATRKPDSDPMDLAWLGNVSFLSDEKFEPVTGLDDQTDLQNPE
jgi:hypothetical protein